jgi:hypothetical protein
VSVVACLSGHSRTVAIVVSMTFADVADAAPETRERLLSRFRGLAGLALMAGITGDELTAALLTAADVDRRRRVASARYLATRPASAARPCVQRRRHLELVPAGC